MTKKSKRLHGRSRIPRRQVRREPQRVAAAIDETIVDGLPAFLRRTQTPEQRARVDDIVRRDHERRAGTRELSTPPDRPTTPTASNMED